MNCFATVDTRAEKYYSISPYAPIHARLYRVEADMRELKCIDNLIVI